MEAWKNFCSLFRIHFLKFFFCLASEKLGHYLVDGGFFRLALDSQASTMLFCSVRLVFDQALLQNHRLHTTILLKFIDCM